MTRATGDAVEAGGPPDGSAGAAGMSDAKPPSRQDAIIRVAIVVGVLVVVFGLILPRFIDYQQVVADLQSLIIQDFLVVSVFGVIAWVLTGAIFATLIAGLRHHEARHRPQPSGEPLGVRAGGARPDPVAPRAR